MSQGEKKRVAWEVVAQFSGKDAGFVAMMRTEEGARAIAARSNMSCRVTRILVSGATYETLPAVKNGLEKQ